MATDPFVDAFSDSFGVTDPGSGGGGGGTGGGGTGGGTGTATGATYGAGIYGAGLYGGSNVDDPSDPGDGGGGTDGGDDGGDTDPIPPGPEPGPPRDVFEWPEVSVWTYAGSKVWVKAGRIGSSLQAAPSPSAAVQPSAYTTLQFVPTYQDAGNWTIQTGWDKTALLTPLSLVTIDWRGERSTWLIESWNPGTPDEGGAPTLVVSGGGGKSILNWCLTWPDATNTLDAQPVYVDTKPAPFKGPAETICRQLIVDNFVNRYGAPLVVHPTVGQGTTVAARPKFDNLFEMVQSLCKDGGIGWDIGLENTDATHAQMHLRFNTPADKTKEVRLSARMGTIAAWNQADTAPTATHALVGYGPDAAEAQTTLLGDVSSSATSVTVASAKNFPDPSGDNPAFRIVIGDETLRVHGFAATALDGAVAVGDSTIKVADTGGFPTVGGSGPDSFPITVGDETMRVTATNGRTWTVDRGVGAGSATGHADKERVQAVRTWVVDRGVGSTVPERHGDGDPVRATRTYRIVTTPTSLAAAAAWTPWGTGGRETYVAGPDSSDLDEVTASGRASLSDGAETRALTVTAAEVPGMKAFTHYRDSDLITVEVETGAVATAPVTAIDVTVDDSGVSVKPTIGNPGSVNSTLRMGQLFQAIVRRVRKIEKGS